MTSEVFKNEYKIQYVKMNIKFNKVLLLMGGSADLSNEGVSLER